MAGNAHGDTIGVETAQTAAQGKASGVAAAIRALGEEAFRLGEKIRNEAEAFAQEEIKAVSNMEDYVRKGLARLRHIEQTMHMMRAPETPALPPAPQLVEDDNYGKEDYVPQEQEERQ